MQQFEIRAFGAAGDGVTDDTSAINAAVNAAKNACPARQCRECLKTA